MTFGGSTRGMLGDWYGGYPVSGAITALFGGTDDVHQRGHTGLDIGAAWGTPIYAPADGEMLFVSRAGDGDWATIFGSSIIVRHADGLRSLLAHMAFPPLAAVGAG